MPVRKIIHIDMDAFYASVEQRDNPELKGKPVAVGGYHSRGVVAAASYEARKFGVHSAMSSAVAKIKCPELRFVNPRFDVYRSVSGQIRKIFLEYTDLVEPLSLDEAFLDVTVNKKDIQSATMIAGEIKKKIFEQTGLTASAGISINKFLAKVASDYQKPDGLFVIKPEDAESFVEKLPVEKFYGVGKVTSRKMRQMGIIKGLDLKRFDVQELIRKFGKIGSFYYDMARAIDTRPVEPERVRKSVGAERTFNADLFKMYEIQKELLVIEKILIERLMKTGFKGRTLTLKIKFDNFQQISRSKSYPAPVRHSMIHRISVELASGVNYANRGVRLLGLAVSNHPESGQSEQLTLDF
ncbi:MAG: DNA polymerase IV [Bacteroidales bacterium]|nr:DNA polymerase IV [Bacteroidales bacterium]